MSKPGRSHIQVDSILQIPVHFIRAFTIRALERGEHFTLGLSDLIPVYDRRRNLSRMLGRRKPRAAPEDQKVGERVSTQPV